MNELENREDRLSCNSQKVKTWSRIETEISAHNLVQTVHNILTHSEHWQTNRQLRYHSWLKTGDRFSQPFSQSVSWDLTDVPPAQRQPLPPSLVYFALHLWLPCTPQLAVQPNGIINTTFFDHSRPSVVLWVIQWIHEAIIGTTIALCIHPTMVTFTRQGSVPFTRSFAIMLHNCHTVLMTDEEG